MSARMAAFARSAVAGDLMLMSNEASALSLYSKSLDDLRKLSANDPKNLQLLAPCK